MKRTSKQAKIVHFIGRQIGVFCTDDSIEPTWWFIRKYLPEAQQAERIGISYGEDEGHYEPYANRLAFEEQQAQVDHERYLLKQKQVGSIRLSP